MLLISINDITHISDAVQSRSMVVLIIEVVNFLITLVRIGQKLSERHQLFKILDGGSRHVHFRLKGVLRCNGGVVQRSRNIPTNVGEHWSQIERTASVFQNSRWRQPPC